MYGITGKLIKEIHSSSQNINVNYLEKGIYFFKVENAQGQKESFKILKSN
ncbi:T9SS type A sorting domain-containing protein [Seonamhaeicola sp. S2-3]